MKKLVFSLGLILIFASQHSNGQISAITDLQQLYSVTDSISSTIRVPKKPLIGLSVNRSGQDGSRLSGTYVNAVIKAGGTPVIIPLTNDGLILSGILDHLDGTIMTGGEDVAPEFYGEERMEQLGTVDSVRDVYDLMLIKMITDRNIPLLGICRGEQLINVAFGGSLYQDIPTQHPSEIKHSQNVSGWIATHKITVDSQSLLREIIGEDTLSVNSFHHQAVKTVAPGFRVTAWAADSIPEAIESISGRPILAVQFHPEGLIAGGNTVALRIVKHLVDQADTYRKAKAIHNRQISVDTHCDTPLEFDNAGFDIGKRETNQVNIPKMTEGYLDAVFFAAYIGQGPRNNVSYEKAQSRISSLIAGIHEQTTKNSDICGIAFTADDALRLKSEEKKAVFIGIENGYAIGKDLKMLSKYRDMGTIYMTLCHIRNKDICDTSNRNEASEWNGLSPFGRKVVKEMNRLGMIVDVSHASEKTFWDVLKISKQPVIASHSATMAVCEHDRNLTDAQLRALAKNGGVIQLCAVNNYIRTDYENATIEDFLRHLDHAVKIAGIDHVGIGNDFDGGGGVAGLNGSNDMINLTMHLITRGYSEEDIAKILGGNFFRVLQQVQRGAKR